MTSCLLVCRCFFQVQTSPFSFSLSAALCYNWYIAGLFVWHVCSLENSRCSWYDKLILSIGLV
jgi:hypothetical protein